MNTIAKSPINPIATDQRPKESWLDYSSRLASLLMSSATGYAVGGQTGALAGAITCLVDEALLACKVTQKHHLTSSLFWTSTVLAPIGSIASKYYSPISSTLELTAYLTGGAALSSLFDDFFNLDLLIRSPLRSIHQANTLFNVNAQEIEESKRSLPLRIFQRVGDFFKNPLLTSVAKKMALIVSSISTEFLFLKYLSSYDLQTYSVKLLQDKSLEKFKSLSFLDSSTWSELKEVISPIALDALKILSALVLKNQLTWSFQKLRKELSHKQHTLVMDKVTACLLHKQRGSQLLAEEEGAELLHHMNDDFLRLMNEGVGRLDDCVADFTNWTFSLATLHHSAAGVLLGYLFSLWPLQKSYVSMIEKIKEYGQDISKASTSLEQIKQDITKNMDQIALRDGTDYLNEQYDKALNNFNEPTAKLHKLKADWEQLTQLHEFYNDMITYSSFGLSMAMNNLTLTDLARYKKSATHVLKRLSGNLTVLNKDSELEMAQGRISKLIHLLQKPLPKRVERVTSLDDSIQIENYSLKLKNQELLHIPILKLQPKTIYSITGPSGCGKSTFLKDLKQGILGHLSSTGTFYLPSSVLFIDQDVYLPINKTLFETICFPTLPSHLKNFEAAVRKQAILNLFEELQINHSQDQNEGVQLAELLDSKDFQLSGGQRKKVAIIQAILQRPKVLILDECFTGLDSHSLMKVKAALKKYLPDTLILSVDHHAHEDHSHFYQHNLHFDQGQVFLR